MPLASVLVSASVGLLTFLSYGAGSANTVFNWLVNVASVASLQSWAGMLFTYIRWVLSLMNRSGMWVGLPDRTGRRWHQGTVYYEKKWRGDESQEGVEARAQIEKIKRNRNWGQPYVRPSLSRRETLLKTSSDSWLGMRSRCACSSSSRTAGTPILLYASWKRLADADTRAHRAVFVNNGWRIANTPGDSPPSKDVVSQFLSAYVPLVRPPSSQTLSASYRLYKGG